MFRSITGKSSLNLHFRQLLAVFLTSIHSSAVLSAAQPKNMKPSLIYGDLAHKTHIHFIRKFYLLGFQYVFVLGLLLTTTLKCKLNITPNSNSSNTGYPALLSSHRTSYLQHTRKFLHLLQLLAVCLLSLEYESHEGRIQSSSVFQGFRAGTQQSLNK